jgi:hypothetical protein
MIMPSSCVGLIDSYESLVNAKGRSMPCLIILVDAFEPLRSAEKLRPHGESSTSMKFSDPTVLNGRIQAGAMKEARKFETINAEPEFPF